MVVTCWIEKKWAETSDTELRQEKSFFKKYLFFLKTGLYNRHTNNTNV